MVPSASSSTTSLACIFSRVRTRLRFPEKSVPGCPYQVAFPGEVCLGSAVCCEREYRSISPYRSRIQGGTTTRAFAVSEEKTSWRQNFTLANHQTWQLHNPCHPPESAQHVRQERNANTGQCPKSCQQRQRLGELLENYPVEVNEGRRLPFWQKKTESCATQWHHCLAPKVSAGDQGIPKIGQVRSIIHLFSYTARLGCSYVT